MRDYGAVRKAIEDILDKDDYDGEQGALEAPTVVERT